MKKYSAVIIMVNLVAFFVFFNHSIVKKEELLEQGELILLELAPVDPRSLMQGDYMWLRYTLSEDINSDSIPKRGFCVVGLDTRGIAQKKRFQKERAPLGQNEYLIEYTSQNRWNINIGAESFFFQEGEAEKYEAAEYGALKVDKMGNSILVGLYDADLKKIE
jgi:uncharacterized membrane-anchored protein